MALAPALLGLGGALARALAEVTRLGGAASDVEPEYTQTHLPCLWTLLVPLLHWRPALGGPLCRGSAPKIFSNKVLSWVARNHRHLYHTVTPKKYGLGVTLATLTGCSTLFFCYYYSQS